MADFFLITWCSFLISMVILSPVFVWCWLENKRIVAERRIIEDDIKRMKNKGYNFTPQPYLPSPLVAYLQGVSE